MEPFYEWNMEGEGERDLKALPYIIDWFDSAGEAVAGDEVGYSYNIDERKLSAGGESYNIGERKLTAIYQFAKTMPLLFVPASHHVKGGDHKRKRCDA
jgi:hypothetical protein